MIIIGLTGSIGMGKTTTAGLFAARGIPVFDADAEVHRLYAGPLAQAVEAAFPGVVDDGRVNRVKLAERVSGNRDALARLEAIVHPVVHAAEKAFIDKARQDGAPAALLDIPLLFETGRDRDVDCTVVVSAPDEIQRARVLARPGMTEDRLASILSRQMPDADKRSRADHVIDTSQGIEAAAGAVERLLAEIAGGKGRISG
ncbi:dephospho-CoA kinase [Oryzibacter oryziterrae]|uniref:dephospho-CoA kinase n=1 Tax=Oryzibacter oryziterrae TaxID=2766474 RepID=UPI001EEF1489|nr:dephospho-CoA kinase [Oryzibacter oryziterrae]